MDFSQKRYKLVNGTNFYIIGVFRKKLYKNLIM